MEVVRCISADSVECKNAQKSWGHSCDHTEWHLKEKCNTMVCVNMYRSRECLTEDEVVERNIENKDW